MNKSTLNFILERIVDWMAERHADFRVEKKGGKAGARTKIVFSKRLDSEHCVWILFAGDQSDSLIALIYWTQQGDSFSALEEMSSDDATGTRGWTQLADEGLIGEDLPWDGRRLLTLGDPPEGLQHLALAEAKKTELYKKSREIMSNRLRSKNPNISDEEMELTHQRADRARFRLWIGIEEMIKMDEAELHSVCDGLLSKIFYLLDKYAFPFLEEKLSVTKK